MRTRATGNDRYRLLACGRRFTLVVMLAGALGAGTAGAQVLVNDPLALAKLASSELTLANQYITMVDQYKQMLVQVTGLGTHFTIMPTTLDPIGDSSELIEANCGSGGGGGLLGDMMASLISLVSQPVSESQRKVCAQIVIAQVDKYNQTVALLGRLGTYKSSLDQLVDMAGKVEATLGYASGTTTQATTYASGMATDMNNWDARMKADDAIIKTLQDQQVLLARLALKGGASSILGAALEDVTFKAAVQAVGH
ncbi:MAG: hypothetical protein ACREPU_01990 [Rhodanobacteraceae bacterium]